MSKKKETISNYELLDARLGVKLHTIINPIDSGEFLYVLKKSGYSEISGAKDVSAYRARKGNIEFYLEDRRSVFGFHGNSVDSVVTAVNDLQGAVKKHWRIDLKSYVWFYEIETVSVYHTEKNVYEIFSKVYHDSNKIGIFEKIVGQPVGQLSVALFPRNKDVNREDWFEVILEPRIASGGQTYHARILYRDKDLMHVANFCRKGQAMIEDMIMAIEK